LIPADQLEEFNLMADSACQLQITHETFSYVYSVLGKHNDPEWPFHLPINGLEERLKLSKELEYTITQRWYETKGGPGVTPITQYFKNLEKLFIRNFYPEIDADYRNLQSESSITVYLNEDYTNVHRDGQNQGRICALLIYLTPEEQYNDGGGELVVNGDEEWGEEKLLKPVRGNVALLDFTNHNPFHAVKEVTNDFKRYCYLTFIWNRDKMPDSHIPKGYKRK
jgi:Rps23 Pro-64 3,4-dihydroxylase Tpa1-like proline 4-hydroxylase